MAWGWVRIVEQKEDNGGTNIIVNGFVQSGFIEEHIWETAFTGLFKISKNDFKKCLVLGLGGGSLVLAMEKCCKILKRRRPEIIGVDHDSKMISLGQKYYRWKKVSVVVDEAMDYINTAIKDGQRFDLICVDLFVGGKIPAKFNNKDFFTKINRLLVKSGKVIFNRFFRTLSQAEFDKDDKKIKEVFTSGNYVLPKFNIIYICNQNSTVQVIDK